VSARDEQAGQTTSWTYDPVGNRLTETIGGVTTSYSYNSLNQLIQAGSTRLSWDANGNLAQKVGPTGVTRYLFDSRDRLVEVGLPTTETVQYGYDQMGRMVSRTSSEGTSTFEWNGWDLAREVDPAGRVTRYFYNGSEMVGFAKDDQQYRVHSDWLGSVKTVTDRNSATVFTADYDPWGEQTSVSDGVPGGIAYRWVGGLGVRWDDGAGLYYMRTRFYDADLHRFLNRDAVRGANRYVYVNNAPIRFKDAYGLCRVEVHYKPVTGGNHAYIVTVDNDGSRKFYRGGPSEDDAGSSGSGSATGGSASGSSRRGSGSNRGSNSSNSNNSSSPDAGGPGGPACGPYGFLKFKYGDYKPGTIDYPENGLEGPIDTVRNDDQPCAVYHQQLFKNGMDINNAMIAYNPFSTNSNAFVREVLERSALPPPNPPAVNVPGWKTYLP
jgi:RHS repeat-associated protein